VVPPLANAGPDQIIILPANIVVLDGSSSSDPDGTLASFAWAKIGGPSSGIISNIGQSITTAHSLTQGIYEFELTVTDNTSATDKDTVRITVNAGSGQSPIANAGNDQVITLPDNNVTLNGAASIDAEGPISFYSWLRISGPLSADIANPTQPITSVNNLVTGVYEFELLVTDNSGLSDKDTVRVTVDPPINACPPIPLITQIGNQLVSNPSGLQYQWYQGGVKVDGATLQVFEINLNEYGVYAVEATANGCTTRSSDFIYLITGYGQDQRSIRLYPNPVERELFIEAPETLNGSMITIIDALGRSLIQTTLKGGLNEIDTKDLSNGFYYLMIDKKGGFKIQKL
jgi:hypothetical protein